MQERRLTEVVLYLLVGLLSNAAGYLLYLLLTTYELPPTYAVTLIYSTTASLSFLGNRRLTFAHEGSFWGSGLKYVIAQLIGYGLNVTMLKIWVDVFGFDHRAVQAVAIVLVASYLFVALKYFVFRRST
jgi:putative flippase GtrA